LDIGLGGWLGHDLPWAWAEGEGFMRLLSKKTTAPVVSGQGLVPNPQMRLREVMRFKHYAMRTEEVQR
jgi:hypothetical protein